MQQKAPCMQLRSPMSIQQHDLIICPKLHMSCLAVQNLKAPAALLTAPATVCLQGTQISQGMGQRGTCSQLWVQYVTAYASGKYDLQVAALKGPHK